VEMVGGELILVLIVTELFAGVESVTGVVTLATLVAKPAFVAVTVIVSRASARLEIVPSEQLMTPAPTLQLPCVGMADTRLTRLERVSENVTLVAVDGPRFVITTL